ncbi:receptor-type tyrosine-protein phosphatase H-like [Cheilinus undulatus]|uniref:receptor-type tyrosine-protein phosphatase H-like n=1 Tax=Cheilinus undulatus TaxID=241271 RepID=UPI001BD59FC7|nr:receptor-type tyrosine-protein phosphatase H-like [Cheilinus undulatus]
MTKALSFISDKWLLYVFLYLLWRVVDSNTTLTPDLMPRSEAKSATTKPPTTPTNLPGNVGNVNVTARTESSITLTWNKVNNIPTYYIQYGDKDIPIDVESGNTVSYEATPLTAGTWYTFTVITMFNGLNSTGKTVEASTLPGNVRNIDATARTESSITLTWNKVNNIPTYYIQYGDKDIPIDVESGNTVSYEATPLTAGTWYTFTVITMFNGLNSTGKTVEASTLPGNVRNIDATARTESSITLTWNKVNNIPTYYIQYGDKDIPISVESGNTVSYEATPLTAGTRYTFTVITTYNELNSTGKTFEASTWPRNAENLMAVDQNKTSITLQWNRVENSQYILKHQYDAEGIVFDVPEVETVVRRTVNDLKNTTEYRFTLFTVFGSDRSSGANLTAYTAPPNPVRFESVGQNETSITLQWTQVNNILSYKLRNGPSLINISASEGNQVTISGLTNTTEYNFTLYSVFENVTSSGVDITAATAPPNTDRFNSAGQTETSITLQWAKVGVILDYVLVYNGVEMEVRASEENDSVVAPVSGLESGTKYSFSVFAVFKTINSSGRSHLAATEPSKVALVSVTERSVHSLTLMWPNAKEDWDYILQINEKEVRVPGSKDVVTHPISGLKAGTRYTFTVTTEFFELTSNAYEDFTVTKIDCESVPWHTTTSSITGTFDGLVSYGTASNGSHTHNVSIEGQEVSVSGLYPGATYEIFLTYEEETRSFDQCKHNQTINPLPLDAQCKYVASGYSIHIAWDTPAGIWTAVEVITPKSTQIVDAKERHVEIAGFQPAKTYKVSLVTISENKKSQPFVFSCATDPRGVIAGSVIGVLIFVVLVGLAVFIVRQRPDIIRNNNPFIGGSKDKKKKSKAIPAERFPDHFYQLGMDESRGFSLEYESLMPVGTEQTHKAAILLENKPRNRFNNVLPYDWCRVKLSSSDGASDYINANYMPGYNSSREYIATQGPLPSTVNDFWRMIWEQRVKGIVMVTNCKESGKTKCEQYWPEDRNPRMYGQLSVTITSEQKELNWTLREFTVRHNNSSEERMVKHFHFTAWPDHGVPQGTEVLIQFRGLVRRHIEREGTGAPTVVHCSAGVGRTGTIIALDVLLQQLERERAVGIDAFVHKMRLNRPHMVQTESQYVFLHQCIMDILQQNEKTEENIYENEDMFYANATALREFQKNGRI